MVSILKTQKYIWEVVGIELEEERYWGKQENIL